MIRNIAGSVLDERLRSPKVPWFATVSFQGVVDRMKQLQNAIRIVEPERYPGTWWTSPMIPLICGSAKSLRIGGGERRAIARCGAFLNRPRDVNNDLPGCSPGLTGSSDDLRDLIQGKYLPFLRDCRSRPSDAVRARLHTRMRLRAPQAGRLPQSVGAGADLLNGRDAHLRTHKPSWPKSQRGLPQLVPLPTRTSGPFAH